tara:strand:+ start:8358 stop:8597 length:240 start_codon:yes stop_codon:yes gene_type:complete
MTHYTDEQIMIRAMPCPKCGALPRQHCYRKPSKDGRIKNHNERQLVWHEHVKMCKREIVSKLLQPFTYKNYQKEIDYEY